jgi:hypothetical protein
MIDQKPHLQEIEAFVFFYNGDYYLEKSLEFGKNKKQLPEWICLHYPVTRLTVGVAELSEAKVSMQAYCEHHHASIHRIAIEI